jgi:SAM-dependent methyltransferase
MTEQHEVNERIWAAAGADMVAEYRAHPLRPVERAIVERYRGELSGRVLEIGVGGGRLTEQLASVAVSLTGIDVAPAMVENCRARFPQATFVVADLRDLGAFGDGAFDAILAGYNVLDVLDHEQRTAALAEWHRVLVPGGLLVVSSHNLHAAGSILSPGRVLSRSPRRLVSNLLRRRRRIANHRRLAPLERRGDGWAVLNDEAHDHALLHYYTDRDHAEGQLAAAGFALRECLDLAGEVVPPGGRAPDHAELHYCATRHDG